MANNAGCWQLKSHNTKIGDNRIKCSDTVHVHNYLCFVLDTKYQSVIQLLTQWTNWARLFLEHLPVYYRHLFGKVVTWWWSFLQGKLCSLCGKWLLHWWDDARWNRVCQCQYANNDSIHVGFNFVSTRYHQLNYQHQSLWCKTICRHESQSTAISNQSKACINIFMSDHVPTQDTNQYGVLGSTF